MISRPQGHGFQRRQIEGVLQGRRDIDIGRSVISKNVGGFAGKRNAALQLSLLDLYHVVTG
jgi:hypothetical protein